MGDALALIIGGPALLYAVLFALTCVLLQVFASYPRCSLLLKWLTLALFSYVATVFMVHVPWLAAMKEVLVPSVKLDGKYLSMLIAILGTTISPYLFFWQASQETEEISNNPDDESLKKAQSGACSVQPHPSRYVRRDGLLQSRCHFHHFIVGGHPTCSRCY